MGLHFEKARKFGKIIDKRKFFLFFCLLLFTPVNVLAFENKQFNSNEENLDEVPNNNRILPEYLLGSGDSLFLLIESLPEYSGNVQIQPDGSIVLPGFFKKIEVEGLSLPETKKEILNVLNEFIKSPVIKLFLTEYRPVTVYVKGEVSKPGLYTLMGQSSTDFDIDQIIQQQDKFVFDESSANPGFLTPPPSLSRGFTKKAFPTVYDAIRSAQGITPYSDLSSIIVIRKRKKSEGGGKISAELDFLSLFKEGDLSQNIRLFDQDVISVRRSDIDLSEQLIEANKSNITQDFLTVFISGNIVKGGPITLPRGAGLNQAISLAGGKKLLTGRVEFLRYDEGGIVEKRSFSLNQSAKLNSYKNPVLKKGDIINVNRSLFGKTSDVLNEIVSPVLNSYTLYKIFTK